MNAPREAHEPPPLWYGYSTPGRFFGNMYVYFVASGVYLALTLVPAYLLYMGQNMKQWVTSGPGIAWAIAVSLAYPVWCWREAKAFERWVRLEPAESRARERAYFKLQSDLARNFWTSVIAVYTIAGLWGLASKP